MNEENLKLMCNNISGLTECVKVNTKTLINMSEREIEKDKKIEQLEHRVLKLEDFLNRNFNYNILS